MEIEGYRIVQELMSNILKHAKASAVNIDVTRNNGHITMIVTDDGRGFDSTQPVEGIGLRNIRSRVNKLNGSFTIDSSPGHGTTSIVEFPVQKTNTR
jgi:signal transduction histidine kinase